MTELSSQKLSRRTFTDEFKNQMVQLYLNGKRKCDIIREHDIPASALNIWIRRSLITASFS